MKQRTKRKGVIFTIVMFSLAFGLMPGFRASAGNMSISANGLNLIKSFESCKLTAYKATSAEKYYTIGWGHYGADVSANMTITQEQADNMLISDMRRYEGYVNTFLSKYGISVNQNQFDALTSFTYNVGNVWLNQTFSLKTYLINGIGKYSSDQIRTSFTNWNKQNGKVLNGLTKRRNREADLFLSGSIDPVILPGVVDTGYSTPIQVVADHKCSTYDNRGRVESNRWIDAGDVCTIHEVYTNGFVKITYPVSGGTRDSFAKTSDFSISKESAPTLRAWFSETGMGEAINSDQFKCRGKYYLCYELIDSRTGERFGGSHDYTITETVYLPDGAELFSYSYEKSNNNWISFHANACGEFKGVVQITGDYVGSVTVKITAPNTKRMLMRSWFSKDKMGAEVTELEKGQYYYLCYSMEQADTGRKLNDVIVLDYSVKEEIVGPDGKTVYSYSYKNSDNNWIGFRASATGKYQGNIYMTGEHTCTFGSNAVCKEKTVAVTGVTLDYSRLSLSEGEEKKLTAAIKPADASNKNVTWKSSNEKAATVSNGVVKAVGVGTAVITVETADGGKKASCTVNVVKEEKNDNPCFVVSKVSGEPGQEAVVDISIKNNPGITGLKVMLEYPSDKLELTDVKYLNLFSSSGSGGDVYNSPFAMTWFSTSSRNETANGVFARAVFKVKEDVEAGEYAVCLKYDTADVINTDGKEISFQVEDGSVAVGDSSLSGDVNGDGTVNMKDIVILQKKLNGWDVTVHEASADMNHDGALNMKDIVLLQKYLNGWN